MFCSANTHVLFIVYSEVNRMNFLVRYHNTRLSQCIHHVSGDEDTLTLGEWLKMNRAIVNIQHCCSLIIHTIKMDCDATEAVAARICSNAELMPVLLVLLIFVCRIFYLPTKLSAHEMIRKFTCSTRNLSKIRMPRVACTRNSM